MYTYPYMNFLKIWRDEYQTDTMWVVAVEGSEETYF